MTTEFLLYLEEDEVKAIHHISSHPPSWVAVSFLLQLLKAQNKKLLILQITTVNGDNYSTPTTEYRVSSVVGIFRFVAPHWFAFFYKGPNPLLSISQCQIVHHHFGCSGVCCISTLGHLSLEETKQGWGMYTDLLYVFKCFYVRNHDNDNTLIHTCSPLKGGLAQGHNWSAGLTHPLCNG